MLLTLASCATPYQQMGYRGGYSDRRIAENTYVIRARVNGFTGEDTAVEYAHRRAGELCPAGYDVIDSKVDESPVVITVRCR